MNEQKVNQTKGSREEPEECSNTSSSTSCRVMKFLDESKEKQILYAKSEGAVGRRVFPIDDADNLKEVISCCLYYNEKSTGSAESLTIQTVVDKLITLSRKCDTPGEVHFFIVWVFYYDYDRNETNSTPLFKVFEKTCGGEAIFFDVKMNTYRNWDEFLDSPVLGRSLICFPKKAEYVFLPDSDSLVVDYRFPKVLDSQASLPPAKYKPFYEVCGQSVNFILESVTESIKQFSHLLFSIRENVKKGLKNVNTWSKGLSSALDSIFTKDNLLLLNLLTGNDMSQLFKYITNADSLGQVVSGLSDFENVGDNGPLGLTKLFLGNLTGSRMEMILLKCIPFFIFMIHKIAKMLLDGNAQEDNSTTKEICCGGPRGVSDDERVDSSIDIADGRIYIRGSPTLPKITKEMRNVLNKDFVYKPHSDNLFTLVGEDGSVQAVMCYAASTAVLVVPKDPLTLGS